MSATLTCPKCHGAMRSYERGGVTVDQCTECRGVFLDRGELEHLIDAEDRWYGGGDRPAASQGAPGAPGSQATGPAGYAPSAGRSGSGGHSGSGGSGGLGAVVGEVLRQAGQSRSSSSHASSSGQPGQKRRKSFLEELLG